MAIDKEKYIKKYIDEGLENVTLVETLLFDIKDGISVDDDLATLLRALHTLKGTSRMLEFKRIEELSHCLESVFVSIREQRIGLSENALKLILYSLDVLKNGFILLLQSKNDNIEIDDFVKNLTLLAANEEFLVPKSVTQNLSGVILKPQNEMPETADQSEKEGLGVASGEEKRAVSPKQQKESKSETIRLSLEKIDGIIKSMASLQSLEITARRISQDSAAINSMIKVFSKTIREIKKNDAAFLSDFRKLERLGEKLNTTLKNYSIDAGNHIRGAYDNVISLRTLPVSTILDNYPRYVFQLSNELGKKVRLNIEGKENEIDKNIIESMSDVFMHMVRNAVDHGLETPDERIASGKDETGNLSIICTRESGNLKICISDDGRGIDLEKIRQKVVREGFVSDAAAAELSREDLTNFIFQSGFSTKSNLSNVSGRGVGMDAVRESIESLKGSVVVESSQGDGTEFTIMVPLSIAALMGFPVVCGKMKFIIPANFVENILLINKQDIITVVDRPEIKYNDRIIKLYYLNQILQLKDDAPGASEILFIVIIRSYDDIAALAVDNIDSMRSVILKNMPIVLEKINIFSGIVLNEDYEMISVLHIPTVIKLAKRIKTIDIKSRNIEYEKLRKSILVVDDSLPTREIESEILSCEGYIVSTASDGAQALKMAKQQHYDLICTDLNMPVMDGFMLIENLKKNEELADIPVIVISSIAVEEEQKRASQLGASRYIIKSSFNNHNLLEAVKELIGGLNGQ
ncbi:MAG: response regulator [Treponema sp.]|nr:response regulator [Treponema sp.]